jgi:hypothetical protein
MDVYEHAARLANEFKALANSQFPRKMYEACGRDLLESRGCGPGCTARRGVSSNEVRSDLIVCYELPAAQAPEPARCTPRKWDQAIRFAKNAARVLIDALYPKRLASRNPIPVLKQVTVHLGPPNLLGNGAVKSDLIMARAHFERKKTTTLHWRHVKGAGVRIVNEVV